MSLETKYLRFVHAGLSDSGKTSVWEVVSKSTGTPLGSITWYAPWRQYTFDAMPNTTWNSQCLQDVAGFMAARMKDRKAAAR